jgi:PAS domain S-box-containing protein
LRINVINNVISIGSAFALTSGERRNIRLANFISLVMAGALLLIILFRILNGSLEWWFFLPLAIEAVLFLSIVLLNKYGHNVLSRIILCWAPAILLIIDFRILILHAPVPETSHYVGFRIFQISFACFPFLIFNVSDWSKLLLGFSVPLVIILFFDVVLDQLQVGYFQLGLTDKSYPYNNFRTLISLLVICSSFLFLKKIIENQEDLNNKLIEQLAEKNILIQKHADDELGQLNKQLLANLEELSKSEFILKNAQRIAKVGSWEFDVKTRSLLWSDQMFEIFEISEETDLRNFKLSDVFDEEAQAVIRKNFQLTIHEKKETDIIVRTTTPGRNVKWLRILGYSLISDLGVTQLNGIVHDITYFKESEARIIASEQNYKSLFEQASDAIMVTDTSGTFVEVNSSMCRLIGYSREELLQMNIASLIDPEQLRINPIKFKELIAGEHVINERSMLHKNGTRIPVEANVKKFGDKYLMAIARDISERRNTALKLLKSIRELDLLNNIIITSSSASNVTELLTKMCESLVEQGGYKLAWVGEQHTHEEKEIIEPIVKAGVAITYTNNLSIDIHDPDQQMHPVVQSWTTGECVVMNYILSDRKYDTWRSVAVKHGLLSWISICINAQPINKYILSIYSGNAESFDAAAVSVIERIVGHIISSIKGIHATKERDIAKRELQRAYERLSYHINNTPLAVIERDKDFKITYWNKRAEELFGWSAEEVWGMRPQDFLVHPGDQENAVRIISGVLNEKEKSNFQERRTVAKDGRILHCLWYYSFLRDDHGDLETVLSFVSDITEQRKANYQLNKRIKELTTLYQVSELLGAEERPMEEVFAKIPAILPAGWQYSDSCVSRLYIFGREYRVHECSFTENYQRSTLMLDNKQIGFIEVAYLENKPDEDEGPFFKEERNLIEAIAEMLQIYITRKLEQEKLNKAQANLASTINNTEIMIWSVDRDFNLLTYNEPFRRFNEKYHNIKVEPGINHWNYPNDIASTKWEERYLRALAGELVVIEENVKGVDLKYSISPIIEEDKIIGVSVFADDVTIRNVQNRELADANKKIVELKMMALRSVMNPHFIFNVLSSIQYFITRNDELNAINYLTSFSKLMRTVLTRSVADFVSLKEEVDLLNDYVYLEKLRFEEKFTFTIDYEDSLDIEDIKIPSLLIQPYVENAILHGLYNKEGSGNLAIRIKIMDDDYLIFEIEDDGIGREAAAAIRAKSLSARKSMGTQLTEERLKILNSDSALAVTYTDLYKGSEPAGTLVTIRIKLHPN